MREPDSKIQAAEKVAGVIAIVAALVVLNGAWQNQHNFANLSWRIVMAGVLLGLAVMVESHAVEALQQRWHREDEISVPDFLRAGSPTSNQIASGESARIEEPSEVGDTRQVRQ